jgi:hypothetical protein
MLKVPFLIIACWFVFAFALTDRASANLVQDGDFSGLTYSGTLPLTTTFGMFGSEAGNTLTLADWTSHGYNFVFAPGTADSGTKTGANSGEPNEAPGQYNTAAGYGNTYLWGPGNGSANGLPATSPAGGNFLGLDGAFETGALTQTITGLTVGQMYVLKFYWAGGQQQSFTGATTEEIMASLGAQGFTTTATANGTEGFSGWMQQSFYYTATATSETLSFLAIGTPSGQPPFSLLGGVDLEVIPDFSNWMVFAGFGAVCVVFEAVRRRRRQAGIAPAA